MSEHDDFWAAREQLTRIRELARNRLVGPWAVLGGVLAYVCSRVGPHVVLPPIVGGRASLNLFVGVVGPSGLGKDAALAVARELLYLDDSVPTLEVGTGQGIDAAYTAQTNEGAAQFCDAALFTLTEIDMLAAHASMGGASIMPTLRKVYSGSALGQQYADKFKRRPVGQHRYRAALWAGIQPARAGVLLNDADGGTPQRWLWMPTDDPGATGWRQDIFDPALGALWPREAWHAPTGDTGGVSKVEPRPWREIKVPDAARDPIIGLRVERLTGGLTAAPGGIDGHALLTRLKVAALLAILCRVEDKVTDDDWRLAGTVMAVSDMTRKVCADALAETSRRSNTARAHLDADRADIIADREFAKGVRAVTAWLRARPGWHTRGEIHRGLHSRYREQVDPALSHLLAGGLIGRRDDDTFAAPWT